MTPSPTPRDDSVNVFGYLQVLFTWKRFLLVNVLVVAVLAAAVTLVFPNVYRATASIVPPKEENGLTGTLSQLTKDFLPSTLLGKLGTSKSAYNYIAILESRTAMEAVARQFGLDTVYGVSNGSMERTVGELRTHSAFDIEDNGTISVSAFDASPARAAAMANAFVDELNRIGIALGTQEAANNRRFVEQRYEKARADMRLAEDSLSAFQKRYRIYDLPEQMKAAVEEAAQIKAQASVAEIELGVLERSLGPDNPTTSLKRSEVEEYNRKLRGLKFGTGVPASGTSTELFVPFTDIPDLGIRYLRLYRDFEIQNKILQFTIPIYEQAKIDEQKNVPVVLVLDRAVAPEKKYGPRRTLIVLAIAIAAFFVFAFLVFFMEHLAAPRASVTRVEAALARAAARIRRRYRVPG